MATETKTFYPGAYEDSSNVSITNGSNPVGKGSNNTTYAQLKPSYGGNVEGYAFWPFDVSAIPDNAVIESVSCATKASVSNSAITASIQLFSGTTGKGSAQSFTSTTASVHTLSGVAFTSSELADVRLRFGVKLSFGFSSYHGRFYGADLTVVYSVNSEKFMLKLGGAWHDIARVFKKVNGIWVEQTDLANVIEDGVRYQNGGEIESTGPTLISFTIAGTSYQAEEGMTWAEWCDSSYNTAGFYVSSDFFGGYVFNKGGNLKVINPNGFVAASVETITSGYTYTLS